MDKWYRIEGSFILVVDAGDSREAREKAQRILKVDGIDHHIINVEEEKSQSYVYVEKI
ncbi:hypothetical protein [Biomaibacter acetigenes]|uniref:hypothetical protein n=1 Tax=Biomaibacter acetigenes TaxID=2316383 RepID=UPI0013CEFABB|nr:hypothetical protein [Biomaibacter acetigenes]